MTADAAMRREEFDVVIVGGGFFGSVLARDLRARGLERVLLLERGPVLLGRASYSNQARVHNGYHYPRSFVTAMRSRVNFPRFVAEWGDAVLPIEKYYAIARNFSKVTARQFHNFCVRIGAEIAPAPGTVRRWFDSDFVEEVFRVKEWVFDATTLRSRISEQLEAADVEVRLESQALRVSEIDGSMLRVEYERGAEVLEAEAAMVVNCTYSRLNKLLADSGLPLIPLKHELAELALVEAPPELHGVGITVMCGPYFSLMPFPARSCHTLSHVRYTPHNEWYDGRGAPYGDPYGHLQTGGEPSSFEHMIRDAQRYLPMAEECRYLDSLWEVKTILPKSEVDDARPILLKVGHGLDRLVHVLGAKLDNVYDLTLALDEIVAHCLGGVRP